jgi:hypothetical protein
MCDGAPTATGGWGSSGYRARVRGGIAILAQGTKVRLKEALFSYSRPHLLFHARQGDVGVVSPPSKQSPAMAKLYTIVRFDQCGHDHRLLDEELEVVK